MSKITQYSFQKKIMQSSYTVRTNYIQITRKHIFELHNIYILINFKPKNREFMAFWYKKKVGYLTAHIILYKLNSGIGLGVSVGGTEFRCVAHTELVKFQRNRPEAKG